MSYYADKNKNFDGIIPYLELCGMEFDEISYIWKSWTANNLSYIDYT